jgi:ArsR family transcriptional regulator, lead/cadmium/zinc/bismuth-responsive transcriptional repressor
MKESDSTPTLPGLLSDEKAVELAEIFRLMSDQTRLRIILLCVQGPICVGDISSRLDVPQSLVSHHLRLLRAGRVLRARRQGKQMYYSVADEHISCVVTDMVEHVCESEDEGHG